MKRACDCQHFDGKRAAVVRLNVGGRSFDATKETLSKCTYFDAYFEGRIDHSTDEQGRLFIDRNGDLFVYMLDFMRSVALPSRKFIAQHKEALLGECAYFGLEFMAQRIRGEISPFDLKAEDRLLREKEMDSLSNVLLDVFSMDVSKRDAQELEVTILPTIRASAFVQRNLADFCRSFDHLTMGLLEHLRDTEGIVFAGGAVVGALTDTPVGDVDIFLVCPSRQSLRQTAGHL